MIDIRKKKVKAIYFNAFHCPECGLELHRDDIVLMTYPAQYSYYCDCGFRTTTTQQPGYEYEFEDDDLPSAYPERIAELFNLSEIDERIIDALNELGNYCTHTIDPAIVDIPTYKESLSGFIRCEEPYYRERGL